MADNTQLTLYLDRVKQLFSTMEKWASEDGLKIKHLPMILNEEALGQYTLHKLIVKNPQNKELAQVVPIGACVIGASGRVDIIGHYDQQALLFLPKGGFSYNITTTEKSGVIESHTKPLFKGIDQDGWYWFESSISRKGHKLSQELFRDLLAGVADDEWN